MNIAIHRYFWERSPTWQRIYAEEQNLAQASANQQQEAENGGNESDHGDDEAEEVIVYRVYGYRVCCAEWREVESGVSRSVQAPVDLAAE